MSLGDIWFVLVGVLLAGYAVFDGFDLGVGTLYPFIAKSETDKAVMRRVIGPVWDGNEVWLLTGGGALFAAFPAVYATVFSGFYLALMVVLFSLIFRAAALEFRHVDPAWAKFWDWAFFLGSAIPSLLFGVAVGNIIRGLPLNAAGDFIAGGGSPVFGANLLAAVNPYALVMGVLSLVWILLHGASWLALKTTDELAHRARTWRAALMPLFLALFLIASVMTALFVPEAFQRSIHSPFGWIAIVIVGAGGALGFLGASSGKDRMAWYGSALAVVGMMTAWAASLWPNIVPAIPADSPVWSAGPVAQVKSALTVAGAASSDLTLTVMLIISAIGVPLVLLYTFLIYRTYRGRVDASTIEAEHY